MMKVKKYEKKHAEADKNRLLHKQLSFSAFNSSVKPIFISAFFEWLRIYNKL